MGKKQRQNQQRGAGRKPHRASGKVDICMTCSRGEEWCFEVGKVGHVSPDYYHSPPQEEEVEPEPQPQEEDGWEALLHSMGVQYCCCICGEWGHFPANCPLPPEECLLRLHPLLPPAEGESLLVLPPLAEGGCLLVPFLPAEGACLLVPPCCSQKRRSPCRLRSQKGRSPCRLRSQKGRRGAGAPNGGVGGRSRSGAPAAAFMARCSPPAVASRGSVAAVAWGHYRLRFAWGYCQPFMAAGNTVAGATQRGATGYEEGGGGEETTSTTAPTTTPVP
ncbi:UNVERIFIED_CONTAM: hypothetical protein FKN15_049389 [Acipenser sinensis]